MSRDLDLEAFCHAEFPRLVRLLALHCGDPEQARDLAQETLVKVCLHWRQVRRMDAPQAWASRVAINLSVSAHRRAATRHRTAEALRADRDSRAGDVGSGVVDGAVVRAALAELPERQRAALILRYFVDQTVDDAADCLGVSPSAVKKLTAKGLAHLRQSLDVEVSAECDGGGPR